MTNRGLAGLLRLMTGDVGTTDASNAVLESPIVSPPSTAEASVGIPRAKRHRRDTARDRAGQRCEPTGTRSRMR